MSFGKKLVILLVLSILSLNLNAKENGFNFKPLFSGGGVSGMVGSAGDYGFGGVGEFAFLFFENGLQMSGHIIGRGDSITTEANNSYGTGSLIGKLSFGGFLPNNIMRSYAFFEGGVGFGGGNRTSALNIIFGGGGGIDFFYYRTGSIYLEAGYLQHYINNELVGGISIGIGTRGFFR